MVWDFIKRLALIVINRDPGTKLDFVGNQKKFIIVSIVMVAASLLMLVVNLFLPGRGSVLNWGIDFKGGTQIQIEFQKVKGIDGPEVEKALGRLKYKRISAIRVDTGALGRKDLNQFLIRMEAESVVTEETEKKLKKELMSLKDPESKRPLLSRFRLSPSGDIVSLQFRAPVTEQQIRAAFAKLPELKIAPSEDALTRPGKEELNKWRISLEGMGEQIRRGLNTQLSKFVKGTGTDQYLIFNNENPFTEKQLADAISKAGYSSSSETEAYITVQITQIVKDEQFRQMLKKANVPFVDTPMGVVPLGETAEKRWRLVVSGKASELSTHLLDKLKKAYVENILSVRVTSYGAVKKVISVVAVGSKVGRRLRYDGIMSVLITLGLLLVYIGLRFDLKFAPGAIVALAHDAIITIGVFAVFWLEFNLDIIAALLTIVGYSLNDTIVIYDRIRENLGRLRDRAFEKVVNTSVNETLSRTVLTSLTTLLAIFFILILARGVIWDFAFSLCIGIFVGTYSTVFIANPMVIWLHNRLDTREGRAKSRQKTTRGGTKARATT